MGLDFVALSVLFNLLLINVKNNLQSTWFGYKIKHVWSKNLMRQINCGVVLTLSLIQNSSFMSDRNINSLLFQGFETQIYVIMTETQYLYCVKIVGL